ncbi:hypothetical protein BDK51DRAFT_34228 [Blyttiomyces helicus]|uniref:Uncharacterized protein n=1 Tax=Blyttiomyces helicus TaxID=388810 RepID=A0A4P9WI46_9FUNG|nr:hypothetical protein BDK51DRAFT_34228 [Blyttiomyces helicus]|eukprot:RKO92521.1 hypothetical protein BDK51DRAFT_34228 [Blyttiomyces helicus]
MADLLHRKVEVFEEILLSEPDRSEYEQKDFLEEENWEKGREEEVWEEDRPTYRPKSEAAPAVTRVAPRLRVPQLPTDVLVHLFQGIKGSRHARHALPDVSWDARDILLAAAMVCCAWAAPMKNTPMRHLMIWIPKFSTIVESPTSSLFSRTSAPSISNMTRPTTGSRATWRIRISSLFNSPPS